jgi:hypothetical protein
MENKNLFLQKSFVKCRNNKNEQWKELLYNYGSYCVEPDNWNKGGVFRFIKDDYKEVDFEENVMEMFFPNGTSVKFKL